MLLDAGRATLELTDATHAAYIDEVEVGRRVAGPIRVAFEVDDSQAATDALVAAGATLIAPPTETAMALAERPARGSRPPAHPVPGARAGVIGAQIRSMTPRTMSQADQAR